jgi:hypothetical protein
MTTSSSIRKLRQANVVTRREFLRGTAVGAAEALLPVPWAMAASDRSVRIESPFHGAILSARHGRLVDGGLAIR